MPPYRKQHYVPEGHLKRFTEYWFSEVESDKIIFVTKKADSYEFQENISNVAYLAWGYSASGSELKFEKALEDIETDLINKVDRILKGESMDGVRTIISYYVAMMHVRSTAVMIAIEEQKLDEDSREIHFAYFLRELDEGNIRGVPLENYDSGVIRSREGSEFITSDNPVICVDTKIALKNMSENEFIHGSEKGDRNIYLCPLSSYHCAILAEKNSNNKYVKTFLEIANIDIEYWVSEVNRFMVANVINEVYSEKSLTGRIDLTCDRLKHPNQEQLDADFSKRRKLGKNKSS